MATNKKTAQQWFLEAYHYDLLEQSAEKAVKAYKKCIQIDPEYKDAYVNLGLIYLKQEDYEKALHYFAQVVQLEPENIEAYINLGYTYEKMDRFGSAKANVRTVVKDKPEAYGSLYKPREYCRDAGRLQWCDIPLAERPSRSIPMPPSLIFFSDRSMTGMICSMKRSKSTVRHLKLIRIM